MEANIVPSRFLGDLVIAWDVNIFDGDGDFVVRGGKIVSVAGRVRFTDTNGWSQDFGCIDDAAETIMDAAITLDLDKLH